MNDFVRRIRRMTDRVGRERGRPLLVACHVPNGVDAALQIGLDVETWLKNDLVDILIKVVEKISLGTIYQLNIMMDLYKLDEDKLQQQHLGLLWNQA